MKVLYILLICLLLNFSGAMAQKNTKKSKPKSKTSTSKTYLKNEYDNTIYGTFGLSDLGDDYIKGAFNYGIGYERKISQKFFIGLDFNYSSFTSDFDKMEKALTNELEKSGIDVTYLHLFITEFDIKFLNLDGYLKIKIFSDRGEFLNGLYCKAGFSIFYLEREYYWVYIREIGKKSESYDFEEKIEMIVAVDLVSGWEYNFIRNFGFFTEVKFAPMFKTSEFNDDKLIFTAWLIGLHYKF